MSPGASTSRSWARTSASSKMVRESGRELLAGALDVLGDRARVGDDLVLKTGVELHVASLVDLLRGQEGRLLLASVRADQARELRRDPLLGHHQRRERPEHQVAILAAHLAPLRAVGREVDRRTGSTARPPSGGTASGGRGGGRPLPGPCQSLAGLRARMIAEPASRARGGSRGSRCRRAPRRRGHARTRRGSARRRCSRSTLPCRRGWPRPCRGRRSRRTRRGGHRVARRAPPRPALAPLSPERLITQFEMTTSTEASGSGMSSMCPSGTRRSRRRRAGLLARARSSISSVMSTPYRVPGRADAARRYQHVGPGARAEVEHGLAVAQLGDRGRVAAARATPFDARALGHVGAVGLAVERPRRTPSPRVGRRQRVAASRGRSQQPAWSWWRQSRRVARRRPRISGPSRGVVGQSAMRTAPPGNRG